MPRPKRDEPDDPAQLGRQAVDQDGFRASFGKATAKAKIEGVTFNDLRGTAVTRLALAEATEAEIATLTGHSLRDVRSVLDFQPLHRDPGALVAPPSASPKEEQKFPTELPTGVRQSTSRKEKAL